MSASPNLPYQPPQALTGGQLMKYLASGVACLVGVATLHSAMVVPAIMHQVESRIDREIDAHAERPHREAAQTKDLILILGKIEELPTKTDIRYIREQLNDIKARVTKLEERP